MIEKEDIIEYYTVALSGGVDEESIQELREELYKAIEEDNQSDYAQVLWELLVQVKRQVDFRSEYYQHVNDVNKADILKYKGFVRGNNKEDDTHNMVIFQKIWNKLSWVNTSDKSVKEIQVYLDEMEKRVNLYEELTGKTVIVERNVDIRELDVPYIESKDGYLIGDVITRYKELMGELYEDKEKAREQQYGAYKEQLYYMAIDRGIKGGIGVTSEELKGIKTITVEGSTGTGKSTKIAKFIREMLVSMDEEELEVTILSADGRIWGDLENIPQVKNIAVYDTEYKVEFSKFESEYERRKEVYKQGWKKEDIKKDPMKVIIIDDYPESDSTNYLKGVMEYDDKVEELSNMVKDNIDLGMRVISSKNKVGRKRERKTWVVKDGKREEM